MHQPIGRAVPALAAAAVCALWREAAQDTASLWTTIDVRPDNLLSVDSDSLGQWLLRSKDLPLGINIFIARNVPK